MRELIIQPILAGLSTGLFCGTTCLPFLAPVLAAEERTARQNAGAIGKFILGRFLGYVLFGAVFGCAGECMTGKLFHRLSAASLVVLSMILLFFAAGLFKLNGRFCLGERARRRTPIFMGLLMGMNLCPPFLLSIAYVFTLHSAWRGIVYFMIFFATTTLYFLPLFFLGPLSRISEFRRAGRLSAVGVGILFCAYGIWLFGK